MIVPVVLTIFVWPTTCAPGNEYGTGNWFNWAKTYSALAGCVGFMLMRYIPNAIRTTRIKNIIPQVFKSGTL